MPASRAPVSVTIPRNPPKMRTKRHTGSASVKPLTGAVVTLAIVAPSTPSTPASDITTVTTASTTRIISKMVNEEIDRFFLLFSFAVIRPLLTRGLIVAWCVQEPASEPAGSITARPASTPKDVQGPQGERRLLRAAHPPPPVRMRSGRRQEEAVQRASPTP